MHGTRSDNAVSRDEQCAHFLSSRNNGGTLQTIIHDKRKYTPSSNVFPDLIR
jgi:hypothetical protein